MNGSIYHIYELEELTSLKCPYHPMEFIFTEIEQTILKFVWTHKRFHIVNVLWRKKSKAGGIVLTNFKLYYQNRVIKII